MTTFPLQVFTQENAPISFNSDYRSSFLAKKFAGMPKGVYVGFAPTVSPPSPILTLSPDTSEQFSLIKVPSGGDPAGMDIVVDQDITLDFTGQPALDFPIHVLARASYQDDASNPTTAEIFTRSATTVSHDEVLICVVDGIPSALTVAFDPDLNERDAPLALSGVDFGFMPAGSVENLTLAVDTVTEVVAARLGLDNVTYPSLSDRLAADQSAAAMAGRLSLVSRALRSNDYSVTAGQESVNVSGSFSEVNRAHEPLITLAGSGSETQAGVVAAPNDTIRNVCLVQDANTGARPVDGPAERNTIFGRLEGPENIGLTGTWTFTMSSDDVVGEGTNAATELQVGDTIQGVDGLFYEIEAVNSNTSITLVDAYRGSTASSDTLNARRWMLNLRIVDSGVEQDASLPTPATVRFFFPAFTSTELSNFDYRLAMHSHLEKEPVGSATTTDPGIGILGTTGGQLGGVTVQNAGVPLGQFHTINFSSASAVVVVGPSGPGEVSVAQIGPPGSAGPTGSIGAPGPTGATGPGFSAITEYAESPTIAGVPAGPPNPFSFTEPFTHNVRILMPGIATWRDFGIFVGGVDIIDIANVSTPSATEGQITGTIAQDTDGKVFLSAAGD